MMFSHSGERGEESSRVRSVPGRAESLGLLLWLLVHPLPRASLPQTLDIVSGLLHPDTHCAQEFSAHIRSNLILDAAAAVRVGVHEGLDFFAWQAGFDTDVQKLQQVDLPALLGIQLV